MKRSTRWVLAAVALQAALFGLYWLVEQQRNSEADPSLETDPPQRVDMALPPLTIHQRDGSTVDLRLSSRPTLVHVWATWCPPCRAELPGLLELPTDHAVDVAAIALDEGWPDVDRFLGGIDSSNVLLGDSDEMERALGVRQLPVTFLLQANGRIVLRFDGARDWTDEAFVKTYLEDTIVGR